MLCFLFEFEGSFQVQTPGGLYLEGYLTEGFFALRDCWAYICRGLYMEGFIFGILRYSLNSYRLFQRTPLILKGYTKKKRSVCLNLCFVAQVENVICHVVDYVACRSISANHKRQFSVRGFRSANSQLFGTFPYDLGKMSSSFLPSTTTEIIVFVFAIPAIKRQ